MCVNVFVHVCKQTYKLPSCQVQLDQCPFRSSCVFHVSFCPHQGGDPSPTAPMGGSVLWSICLSVVICVL